MGNSGSSPFNLDEEHDFDVLEGRSENPKSRLVDFATKHPGQRFDYNLVYAENHKESCWFLCTEQATNKSIYIHFEQRIGSKSYSHRVIRSDQFDPDILCLEMKHQDSFNENFKLNLHVGWVFNDLREPMLPDKLRQDKCNYDLMSIFVIFNEGDCMAKALNGKVSRYYIWVPSLIKK